MGFVFTLFYVALTLLSPAAFPEVITNLHVGQIFGVLTILAILPSIPEAKLGRIPETYIAFGLLIAASLSILATGWMGGAVSTILGFSPILFAFYFVSITCRSLRRLKILTAVLLGVALFIFANGAMDFFFGNLASPYLEPEKIADTVLYRFRGMGIISDPNDLSQVFVMLIPLMWLWWKPGNTARNFLLTILPAAILAVAIYFTHSRGAVFALMAVILFGCKDKLGVVRSSILVGIAFAGVLALGVSGGRGMDEDDGGRVAAWSLGLELTKAHPLFGVGVDNFSDYNDTGMTAHNSYVLSLAETGAFGYFFWMGMIVSGWSGLSRIVNSKDKVAAESDSAAEGGSSPPVAEPSAFSKPWLGTPEMNRIAVPTGPTTAAFSHSALYASERNYVETRSPYPMGEIEEDADAQSEEDRLIYAAKVLRVTFVGLLTSAFFISRTYSVTLYVMLGMGVALRMVYQEKHPEMTVNVRALLKQTGLMMLTSFILLYLFVRLHGR